MTMAQTSTAQREPSMEEILASIRRIIEDSDNVRQPLEGAGGVPFSESQFSRPAEEGESEQEVEAFRAGLDEAVARSSDALEDQAVATFVEAGAQRRMEEPAPETVAQLAQRSQVEILPFANAAAERADYVEPVLPSEPESYAAEIETSAGQPVAGPAPATAEARPSLISDHTGRQVAAAFGELSEAFAASRRRSFDEMAEEMLRPMLQDWLDNNLPTLVERLVREEIERVARGS